MRKLILTQVMWSTGGQHYQEPRLISVNCTPKESEDELLTKANNIVKHAFTHEYGNEAVYLSAISKRTISDKDYSKPSVVNE